MQAADAQRQVPLGFPAADTVLRFHHGGKKWRSGFCSSLGKECYKGVSRGCVSRVKVHPCRPPTVPPGQPRCTAPWKSQRLRPPDDFLLQRDAPDFSSTLRRADLPSLPFPFSAPLSQLCSGEAEPTGGVAPCLSRARPLAGCISLSAQSDPKWHLQSLPLAL